MVNLSLADSRGKQSTTKLFVTLAFFAVLIKYILSGYTIPFLGFNPLMPAGEFGTAIAMILAIWLGREWQARPTVLPVRKPVGEGMPSSK